MNSLYFEHIDQTIEVPSEWHELSSSQIDFVLKHIFDCQMGIQSKDDTLLHLLFYFLAIDIDYMSVARERLSSTHFLAEKYGNLLILAERLFGQWFEGSVLNFDSVHNPYPILAGCTGSNVLLADISFKQFKEAIRHSGQFYTEKDTKHLDLFIQTLYKNALLEEIQLLPEYQKIAVLLYFTNCIKYLQTEDILVDGNLLNFSELFPKGKPANTIEKNNTGWLGLQFDLAEKGAFGTVTDIDQENLYKILTYLLNNLKKAQREKK